MKNKKKVLKIVIIILIIPVIVLIGYSVLDHGLRQSRCKAQCGDLGFDKMENGNVCVCSDGTNFEVDSFVVYKPVLYLYPENDNTLVKVSFEHPENLIVTYPKYNNGWIVTANKNGDLYDDTGKYYYALYWEEDNAKDVDFSEGFYVTKDNAIKFLEEKLTIIGLNDREANEFIMYWLPILEENKQSLVYFELTDSKEKNNKLIIEPKPESLLRVAIHVKKVNKKVEIKEQVLPTFKRIGFVAVEWGGVIHN